MDTGVEDEWLLEADHRIRNEFWVAPDGNVLYYRPEDGDTSELIAVSIMSLHRCIAHQRFPFVPHPDDYMTQQGYISVQVDASYRHPMCVGYPTQAQINTMWDYGYTLDDSPCNGLYGLSYHFVKR